MLAQHARPMTGRDDPAEVAGLADRIVGAVTGCAAVAGLTEAPGGPVATYLPGRTISGVAVRDGEVEVCVVARYGLPLPEVAEQVRQAVAPLVPDRVVDVVIGDITLAEPEDKGPDGRDHAGLSGRQAGVPGLGPGSSSRPWRRPRGVCRGAAAMAGTDDRAAAGAGTAGSGNRLPAPAGSRRLGGALAAPAQAAPVAAAALNWLGVAGAAE